MALILGINKAKSAKEQTQMIVIQDQSHKIFLKVWSEKGVIKLAIEAPTTMSIKREKIEHE